MSLSSPNTTVFKGRKNKNGSWKRCDICNGIASWVDEDGFAYCIDHQPLCTDEGHCQHCGEPLPENRHWNQRYCNIACRDAAAIGKSARPVKAAA
ncbi:MAG: hypothetical protein H6661_03105 [Ardenticatenaceae bacterium]|nr:hypothetical protein [Ardenticatenaceae bacterium]